MTDLSPLSGLHGLQSLHLYGCRPAVPATFLRVLVDHPHLTTLDADEAVGVPREVLSHNEYDNCLPRLRAYFSSLGAEAENEVKVVLLGNGELPSDEARATEGTPGSTSSLSPSPRTRGSGRFSSPTPGGMTSPERERPARRPSSDSTRLSKRTASNPSGTATTSGPETGSPPSSANSPAPISSWP